MTTRAVSLGSFALASLTANIDAINADNVQGEYYHRHGGRYGSQGEPVALPSHVDDYKEALGVFPLQACRATHHAGAHQQHWMSQGVTMQTQHSV